MAGKNLDFQTNFGWKQGWESDFFKIKILENHTCSNNLDNLLQVFGADKGKL